MDTNCGFNGVSTEFLVNDYDQTAFSFVNQTIFDFKHEQ